MNISQQIDLLYEQIALEKQLLDILYAKKEVFQHMVALVKTTEKVPKNGHFGD